MVKWNYNNISSASDHQSIINYNKGIQWYDGNTASDVTMAML